jgi:hypothetical protein
MLGLGLSLGNPLLRVPQRVDTYNVAGGLLTGQWNYDGTVLAAATYGDADLYWVDVFSSWYGSVGFVEIPSVTKPSPTAVLTAANLRWRAGARATSSGTISVNLAARRQTAPFPAPGIAAGEFPDITGSNATFVITASTLTFSPPFASTTYNSNVLTMMQEVFAEGFWAFPGRVIFRWTIAPRTTIGGEQEQLAIPGTLSGTAATTPVLSLTWSL